MSEDRFLSSSTSDHVTTVTLERAEALNAISGAMADQLAGALERVAHDRDTWVMVLAAAGDKGFCAGADLKERAAFSLEDFHRNRKQIRGLFEALRSVPQPTIASVFGFALGGGFELALSCDLIVAAEDAVFALPEASVGLLPAGGGTQLLARAAGSSSAKDVILTGRRLTASEAAAMGLVARVVARADLSEATDEVARSICRASPVAVRAAKRAINASLGVPLEDGIEIEHAAWAEVIASEDRAEGIAAFNAKRPPEWSNE